MAHLNLLHFDGDCDDLLARKQRYLDPVTARVGPRGPMAVGLIKCILKLIRRGMRSAAISRLTVYLKIPLLGVSTITWEAKPI